MASNSTSEDEFVTSLSKLEITRRLFTYVKAYSWRVVVIVICMIIVMGIGLLNPYLLKVAIDKYVSKGAVVPLFFMGVAMVVLNGLGWALSRYRIIKMAEISNEIVLKIRQELYTHIQQLTFSFFDHRPVGKVLARVIGDVNSLQKLFADAVTNLIPEILSLISVAAIMFALNIKLAVASMLILPFLIVAMSYVEIAGRKRWQDYRKKRSNLNGYTHEDFSGIRVVQFFAMEDRTESVFRGYVKDMMKSFMKAISLSNSFWPMVELSWGLGMVIVYGFSMHLMLNGDITLGILVAFTWYITMFWRPIMNISNFYNTLITNFAAAERIFEILDINPDIDAKTWAPKLPKIKGKVEFQKVTFGYGDEAVLKNVSFAVNPGDTVALVGPTGAGKTTITNLISRFYDVDSGSIKIDGNDISEVSLESLRSQMGIMLQDTFLFSTTIKENIRYGKLDATDEEIVEAAKAVHAHTFIMELEKGYDTEVSERGARLSVGQRQLISFARALLANPRILILDEATSNIDTFTERLVQKGISKILHGRTSFVIAHRLSTIRNANIIFVIDDGRIIEQGNHESLMALKGMYYQLYQAQYKFLNEGA